MAYQFVTVPEKDLGAGVDSQSAPNQIPDGFIEDARNADPLPTGGIAKRRGYQGYAGELPVRVERIVSDDTKLSFVLNTSIDLSTTRSTPLVVYGRSSNSTGGDILTTDTSHYYSSFNADPRYTFDTANTPITIPGTLHGFTTALLWVGVGTSLSEVNASNEEVFVKEVAIDQTTFDITITYVNGTGADFTGYVYIADHSPSSTNYVSPVAVLPASATTSFPIPFATHGLSSGQILVKCFLDDGTNFIEVEPNQVTIDPLTSLVTVILINSDIVTKSIFFSLSVAPAANRVSGAVLSGTTNSILIPLVGFDAASFFLFLQCWIDDGINPLVQVLPNSIEIDAAANTATIEFVDSGAGGANFTLYWQFVDSTIKTITVTQATPATYLDDRPQLSIWGLSHSEIYNANGSEPRPGWTSHIDSYRAQGEGKLVSGLGGNLFVADENPPSILPTLPALVQGIVATDTVIAPAFWDTGELPGRTRGFVSGDNGGVNVFPLTSITYQSGSGWVLYTISVPNIVVHGSLATIFSTTDQLTITEANYSYHNGVFDIKQVAIGTDSLLISIENPLITDSDFDVLDGGGVAGVYTDHVPLTSTSYFLANDSILAETIPPGLSLTGLKSVGDVLVLTGMNEGFLGFPGGLRLSAGRTSSVIPVATVSGLVRGDMLSYTGIEREIKVKHINELIDTSVTIDVGDGQNAVVTLLSGDTNSLWEGETILLISGNYYEGVYTVTDILSSTMFKIATTIMIADAATLVGNTISIDEDLAWISSPTNSTTFAVVRRWQPIEAPDDNFNSTPSTYVRYLDTNSYADQPILRSTMVKDSLYLTNGDDEVLKYDGVSNYRAGLFRWQAHLFLGVDTTAVGKIVVNNPTITTAAHAENKITLTAEVDKAVFQVGDRIKYALDGELYTIRDIQVVSSVAYLYVDRRITIATATSTLVGLSQFQYYLRMNAIDINNNIVASAATGASDLVVELTANAAVKIRATGMPAFDAFDYDRLEVIVCRTKANAPGVFYSLATLSQSFNVDDGYLDFIDATPDDSLFAVDPISVLIPSVTVPTAIDGPPRAKLVTNAGNRLVLGNVQDFPTADIQLLKLVPILTPTNFIGQRWGFRKDNKDSGTTTNMLDRAFYEFVDATSPSATVVAASSSVSSNFFTIETSAAHGASIGDWVYIYRSTSSASPNLRLSGWWQLNGVPSSTSFTVSAVLFDSSTAVVAGSDSNAVIFASTKTDIPVALGQDYNYGMFNGNPSTSIFSYEFTAGRRLANAINTSQRRMIGQPWLTANAGNEFTAGQLIIKQPKVFTTTLEVVVPDYDTGVMSLFVNNSRREPEDTASAVTAIFPSRLVASVNNFPEIFDAPTSLNDIDSFSAIDVNAADGQEITAIIPFFGDSAFGAALKSGIIVVFKNHSIYLVDLSEKDKGNNPVQRLDSRGKGCTAPGSVAVTKDGIMFEHDTGYYRLNRNLSIDYIGRKYKGIFDNEQSKQWLSLSAGHHDSIENKYKVSYVTNESDGKPAQVAVYDHTREYQEAGGTLGSWTTYTNHAALGWANLNAETFFGDTAGRVFKIRRTLQNEDYRDDSSPIEMTVVTKARDFGDSGIRKVVRVVVTHYLASNSNSTLLKVATDLLDSFEDTDPFILKVKSKTDLAPSKVLSVESSLATSKALYFQLLYFNGAKDEPLEIVGIDWRVAGLNHKGIIQAASTTARD